MEWKVADWTYELRIRKNGHIFWRR